MSLKNKDAGLCAKCQECPHCGYDARLVSQWQAPTCKRADPVVGDLHRPISVILFDEALTEIISKWHPSERWAWMFLECGVIAMVNVKFQNSKFEAQTRDLKLSRDFQPIDNHDQCHRHQRKATFARLTGKFYLVCSLPTLCFY